ncbi:unnamed protein product, partial [Trichogramma brassicae]
HTLVPLHPLPGPAHRRQVEVRPPPPNSQRKGSRCDRCPCEDHAQLWRAQKQPTQAVCSCRRLHTPVRSPRLVHSSTNASLHTTGGVSPPTSLPVCDRRPAACRYEATYVLAGMLPLALLADERARLYGRRREDAKNEERLATLSKWQEAWDRSKKARWTHRLIPNIRVWIERRHGELNYHLTQLLTGHGFFKQHSRRYDHNQSAQCPVCPLIHRECGARVLSLPEVQRRKRETTLPALRGHDARKHHQAHARDCSKLSCIVCQFLVTLPQCFPALGTIGVSPALVCVRASCRCVAARCCCVGSRRVGSYARRAAGSAGAWVDGRGRRDEPAGEQLAAVDADEDDDPLCGDCGVHDTENHRRPSASKRCPAPDPRRVCDRELQRENDSYRRTCGRP